MQFSERIRIKFTKEIDAMDVHFTLMNIRKMATESQVEFAYRVNKIAANNNVAEPSTVKCIIAALNGDPVYAGIQNTRFNTLDELTSQFEYCEMMSAMKDCKKKPKLQTQFKVEDKSFNSTALRCFKCNERGHKKADCPTSTNVVTKKDEPNKVRISCTYCKFTGHTEDRCFKNRRKLKMKWQL